MKNKGLNKKITTDYGIVLIALFLITLLFLIVKITI